MPPIREIFHAHRSLPAPGAHLCIATPPVPEGEGPGPTMGDLRHGRHDARPQLGLSLLSSPAPRVGIVCRSIRSSRWHPDYKTTPVLVRVSFHRNSTSLPNHIGFDDPDRTRYNMYFRMASCLFTCPTTSQVSTHDGGVADFARVARPQCPKRRHSTSRGGMTVYGTNTTLRDVGLSIAMGVRWDSHPNEAMRAEVRCSVAHGSSARVRTRLVLSTRPYRTTSEPPPAG